jgi:hypothetical protein
MALQAFRREFSHHTERIHSVSGGTSLRGAMFGPNDGLVAAFAVRCDCHAAIVTYSVGRALGTR